MGQAFFGGTGVGGSTSRSGYTVTSGPVGLVGGRLAANGGTYALMTSLAAMVAGYTGTVTVNMTLGGGSCSFAVGNPGNLPTSYAGAGTNGWLFNGGSYNLVFYGSGGAQVRFNRGPGGSTSDSNGTSFGANTVAGYYTYSLVPTAPQSVAATPSTSASGAITVTWSAPADDGGSGISGYQVLRGGTAIADLGVVGTYTDTGLTPGTSYTYTVRAKNAVTAAAGTQSVDSSSSSATAPGNPTAPQSLTATASSSHTGRIDLSWSAPATPGTGGITGYNIFQAGTQIATTTGTGTTYAVTGLTAYTSYSFTVRARNAFSDANSTTSTDSNTGTATAPGPPSAPTSLTATPDGLTPGKISLAWTAPTTTGTGGITGYNVYFSTGTLITSTTGTGVAYDVLGLNPGQTYSFYVTARNALADAEGSESAHSNTAAATALGEPPAPTGLTVTASSTVPNRIALAWTPPAGGRTGFKVFDHNTSTNVDTFVAFVKTSYYYIDGLTAGVAKTYFVRTTNTYTDTLSAGYPGNYGGPASSTASATPSADFSDAVPSVVGVTDSTNSAFNGTFTINAVTSTTVGYAKTAANVASTAVPAGATITDNTNATFNGTFTIATPTANTITYSKTASNITSATVSGGLITNVTNGLFNGTKTVTAVNVGAKTISYAAAGTVSSVAVPTNTSPGQSGTVTNQSNAVYNGSGLAITSIPTPTTLTYAKTSADIGQTNAAGTVVDTTNQTGYNGTVVVASIPSYNTFTYATAGSAQSSVAISGPGGDAYRNTSPATLDIEYRSGWAG